MVLELLGFLNVSLVDIVDIILVAIIIYLAFRWIRGSSAMNIFIAIILLLVVRVISVALGMKMVSSLLGTIIDVGAVAFIVIFQPEIRRFLNNVGRSAGNTIEKRRFMDRLFPKHQDAMSSGSMGEIAEACREMADQMTGALIVIRRRNTLDDIISTGDTIDSRICRRLIMNIFFKNSPLHDGAMVVGEDRIIAARCTLPISDNQELPAHYGMRHKAAVGISEQSDADVVVVSEQTGRVSFVRGGVIRTVESINELKLLLGGPAE